MLEDQIVAQIRKVRQAHSEKYGHDLKKICEALREQEKLSESPVLIRQPKLVDKKAA